MRQWQPYLITFLLTLTGVAAVAGSFAAIDYRAKHLSVQGERERAQEDLEESRKNVRDLEVANDELDRALGVAEQDKCDEEEKREKAEQAKAQAEQELKKERGRELDPDDPKVTKIVEQATKECRELVRNRDLTLVRRENEIKEREKELVSARQVSRELSGLLDSQPWLATKYWRWQDGKTQYKRPLYIVWTKDGHVVMVVEAVEKGRPTVHAGNKCESDSLTQLRRDLQDLQDLVPPTTFPLSGSASQHNPETREEQERKLIILGTEYALRTLKECPTYEEQYLREVLKELTGEEIISEPNPEDQASTSAKSGSPS